MLLALFRAVVLVLLFLMLAEPVLTIHVTNRLRPTLWLVLDGTASMAIPDQLPEAERSRLMHAVAGDGDGGRGTGCPNPPLRPPPPVPRPLDAGRLRQGPLEEEK